MRKSWAVKAETKREKRMNNKLSAEEFELKSTKALKKLEGKILNRMLSTKWDKKEAGSVNATNNPYAPYIN